MKHVAILLAGGSGSRMGSSVDDKVLAEIAGMPVFGHVLKAFCESGIQDGFVIVTRDNQQRKKIAHIIKDLKVSVPVLFTLGGQERQDSVRAGLDMVPNEADWIYIHDCARPAVTVQALKSVRKALLALRCPVSLAHRVIDTIRQFEESPVNNPSDGSLLVRDKLWAMETPQGFPRALIDRAHAALDKPVTDDLAAVELLGKPIALVESLSPNPKLTRAADFILLESLLAKDDMTDISSPTIRTGLGYDIHQLKEGLPLTLGGVKIKADVGLVGHSDADVLSHAIADAILGACGLPDIGHYFPNTDEKIKGISSQEILKKARKEARKLGLQIVNIDSTLIAEKPKVAPYVATMKNALAKTLHLQPQDIGIKATTQEKIGALGNGDGIAAHAITTLHGVRKRKGQA